MSRLPPLLAWLLGLAVALPCAADIRQFPPETIEALGRTLFEVERRTDIAIELANEHHAPDELGVESWVTEGDPAHLLVRFLGTRDGTPVPVLDARFDELLLPDIAPPAGPALTPFQRAQIAARTAVQPYLENPCSARYGSLAVPDPESDGLLLYAIALDPDEEQVLLGGHHRFSLSADGTEVRHADALSTSCVRAPREELARADGVRGTAVRTSLGDTPLEIHVYLSLRHRLTLYVVTRDLRMWEVRDGHMRVIRERPGELSSAAR